MHSYNIQIFLHNPMETVKDGERRERNEEKEREEKKEREKKEKVRC